MSHSNAYRPSNAAVRMDGTTMQERIEETITQRLSSVEYYQSLIDAHEERGEYIPEYLLSQYQSAVESLESYADYWGFDC